MVLSGFGALLIGLARGDGQLALKGFDPIELIDGREVPGERELFIDHGAFRYLFASEENRDLFLDAPERWGIQWDGACGRMGPLSGMGAPDRFAVWNERIWVFASDQCRAGFLKAPDKLQPPDEAPPAHDDAAKAAGQALLEKAAAAFGDVAALDALKSVHLHATLEAVSGTTLYEGTRDLWFAFPARYRFEESWGGRGYGHAVSGAAAKRFSPEEELPLGAVSTKVALREALQQPLWIARERKNLLAVPAGSDTVDGRAVELVTVHAAQHNVTLALDAKSGRLVELRFLALTSRGYAPVVRRVTGWQTAGKLTLPVRLQEVALNGLADDSVKGETQLELDVALDEQLFAPPAK
ncbi:MAG: hypothetical protein JNL90_12405 [Planctomycetes bacterium]|nr:hypothetical protein [Planctomycetota bacterium]